MGSACRAIKKKGCNDFFLNPGITDGVSLFSY
jgi:hypothetical protein